MKRIVLVTGGARSGKSRYALDAAFRYKQRAFIATAQAFDAEMAARIAKHRAERKDGFLTVEEPLDLASAIAALPPKVEVAVIDCLTVWLGNLAHRHGGGGGWFPEIDGFLNAIARRQCDLFIVTNEIGMGIVPDNRMARQFRDTAGRLNARVAEIADQVVFMVSGIAMLIKPPPQSH